MRSAPFPSFRAAAAALGIFATTTLAVVPRAAAYAAEATTGTVVGRVTAGTPAAPVANVDVVAVSASGRSRTKTDSSGRFALLGVAPDTYTFSFTAPGFEARSLTGITVLPGARIDASTALVRELREIGRLTTRGVLGGNGFGETQDVFRITGDAARGIAAASSSGLGSYTQGTVQGAIASAPGVQQDQFANVILQGGKVKDTVFSYDAVPVPQALIAEPGGNVVGAQLPTTGLGYTQITTGGFSTSSNQGLAGIVDEIPATGVYPAQTTFSVSNGIVPSAHDVAFASRWATPDLRRRYAVDATLGSEAIEYGDGHTFYPSEAATYGLSLSSRATWSVGANAHLRVGKRDDLSFVTLEGQAVYDQYGTPFAGQTYGAFAGDKTAYPGAPSPEALVRTPTRIRGSYAVQKIQDLRSYDHSTVRLQAYASEYGSQTRAPFFDDLSFPNGPVSYFGNQNARLFGLGLDVQDIANRFHEFGYGAEVRTQASSLDQLVPTQDNHLTSQPILNSYLGYVSDRYSPTDRLVLTGTLRATGTWIVRSDGHRYGVSAVDPHLGLNYTFAPKTALLVTYDHTTQAPNPLEAERIDASTPFVPIAPESGDAYQIALQHTGAVRARIGYFAKSERNLVDVLPFNVRGATQSGENASAIGVPTNAGNLLVHGLEFSAATAGFTLSGTYTHGFSSSASQFAYNALNAPAIAAGHLFPLGYVPDFSALASFDFKPTKHVTISPTLSYETGYPYGNGRSVFAFDDATGAPVQLRNDNFVNPGFNYYFLSDPSKPFDAATNPYIANLGTPETDEPNSLRSKPQLLASLRVRVQLAPATTLLVDVQNLFGNASPTQVQGNPYLIGPPGYAGGTYGAALCGKIGGATDCATTRPYTLGNGVPTRDGQTPALPFQYGTAGYIPSSYPNARAVYVRLQQRL
ncbi:MAG: hypothetical protein NVS4B5_14250 [Vulcanimicrobiaceae bacterium]